LICRPIPADAALDPVDVETWLTTAHARAASRGIVGADVTPFILDNLRQLSNGQTVIANRALAQANANLAATIAVAIASAAAKRRL